MQLEVKKYLYDIQQAATRIIEFTSGQSFESYQQNAMLRSAVERQFEIVGEAVARLSRLDSSLVARITDYRRIVSFRNILIHGYAQVDDRLVWDLIEGKLPQLQREVSALLQQA